MKLIKQLSKSFAENWTKPRLQEAEIDALSHAYETGFLKAKEELMKCIYREPDNIQTVEWWRGFRDAQDFICWDMEQVGEEEVCEK